MRLLMATALLALHMTGAVAAPPAAPVQREIQALMTRLETSGCKFQRNGTWYAGAEAKAHLLDKLDYISKRKTLETAEQFITLAASESSISGKPYWVQCAGREAEHSQDWLLRELGQVRATPSKTPAAR